MSKDSETGALPAESGAEHVPVVAEVRRSASRVQSVDRAAALLRAVADSGPGGAGTVALGRACGLNRATAWRLLVTLSDHGLVRCDGETGRWTIGPGLIDLTRSSQPALREVHRVLEHLALRTGETAALAVLRSNTLVYADEVASPSSVVATWSGGPVSLHATSAGKVHLAWSPMVLVQRCIAAGLDRYTDSTITDPEALLTDLTQTRERGYATCHGEFDRAAWGVSAPVLGAGGVLVGALSIWGPGGRVVPSRFPELGALAIEAATRIAPV